MFAAAVCVVCSIFVSSAAVLLKDRQEENKVLDRQSKVLSVAGLIKSDEKLTADQIRERFKSNIKAIVIERESGEPAADVDPSSFDQRQAKGDPARSTAAPPNDAKVARLPNQLMAYELLSGKTVEALILPIEGKGLWSTLYGFLALNADARTIRGITFYEHGETPGLGGEIENPTWVALWPGRKAFDESWEPKISVKKGAAGPVESDPYQVDGLSGATITSRGVTSLVHFWLGDDGFGPFLENYRKEAGIK
jgi:Na+-transporting NADH:ubiquinone oxidoreductase subunit C